MRALALLACLAVAGCGAESRPMRTPSGRMGIYIECTANQGDCLDEAAKQCPHGYEIYTEGGGVRRPADQESHVTTVLYRGHMLIECRQRPPPAP